MHSLCHFRPLPSSLLSKHGSHAVTRIVRRLYSSENPKWSPQAEEQFSELFKVLKEDTPGRKDTSFPPGNNDTTFAQHKPNPYPSSSTNPFTLDLNPFPRQQAPRRDYRTRVNKHQEIPGIPNFGDQYAEATRMRVDEARPSKPFEHLEEEEKIPQLADEKGNIIKLWIENLPITDESAIGEALSLISEHPISVSGLEIVSERGMIATKSAFITVNFGANNRDKIFQKVENFGLTVKGMRCPVRTAEVKRSLQLIELGQLSEEALVAALKENNINFATYDYPQRYNSPQRQSAFPFRGSVILTFRSHKEAHEAKLKFDSDEGVMMGQKRVYAMWGAREASAPLETRVAANYIRNLIWENRDLRRYVSQAREVNEESWKEPEGLNRIATMFAQQGPNDKRSELEELRQELEETRKALAESRKSGDSETVAQADQVLRKGTQTEAKVTSELAIEAMLSRSGLNVFGATRSISPFLPRIEDPSALSEIKDEYTKSVELLKARHAAELKSLREIHTTAKKKVVQEMYIKNHRNSANTALELGITRRDVAMTVHYRRPKKQKSRLKLTPKPSDQPPVEDLEKASRLADYMSFKTHGALQQAPTKETAGRTIKKKRRVAEW